MQPSDDRIAFNKKLSLHKCHERKYYNCGYHSINNKDICSVIPYLGNKNSGMIIVYQKNAILEKIVICDKKGNTKKEYNILANGVVFRAYLYNGKSGMVKIYLLEQKL
jgi:hypothetical protein